jgi:hypothetical protein
MTPSSTPWNVRERKLLERLDTPEKIQDFLDSIPYNDEVTCRSPRRVMRDRKAHCMEGALFAAAALAHHGEPPLLVDLRAVKGQDDDHVIALYRRNGLLGAVAKSNFTTLRHRSPVYRSLRELAMSYFDFYFNLDSILSLQEVSRPLALTDRAFPGWRVAEVDLDAIGEKLDRMRHEPLATPAAMKKLKPVSRLMYQAGMLGSNPAGLFRPKK